MDRSLIRELFARAQPDYSDPDAARLTGSSIAALQQAVRNGELEPHNAFRRYAWSHVAAFAIEKRWTLRMVDEALRPDLIARMPPLNRMAMVTAAIPLYQLQFLEWQAACRDGLPRHATTDDALAAAIDHKIASTDLHEAEIAIPGIGAAIDWPSDPVAGDAPQAPVRCV